MMEVRYAGEVFDDLRPSVDWLNSRKPGLGFGVLRTVPPT